MPRKVRQLIKDLKQSGFTHKPGKGSHRKFYHDNVPWAVVISGGEGDDAKPYQERDVKEAIEESKS